MTILRTDDLGVRVAARQEHLEQKWWPWQLPRQLEGAVELLDGTHVYYDMVVICCCSEKQNFAWSNTLIQPPPQTMRPALPDLPDDDDELLELQVRSIAHHLHAISKSHHHRSNGSPAPPSSPHASLACSHHHHHNPPSPPSARIRDPHTMPALLRPPATVSWAPCKSELQAMRPFSHPPRPPRPFPRRHIARCPR